MFLCSRYWRKVKIWSIQPCPGLNPGCCSQIWFSLTGVSLWRIIEVSSLVMMGVRLIPLWFSHTVFLPILKIRITVDSPQLSGTDSDCQILSNNWVITLMRVALLVLNSAGGRSSGPAALLSFNPLKASLTSVSVEGSLDTVQTETGSVFGWESGWGCWQCEKCDWKCSGHLFNRCFWLEIREKSFYSITSDTGYQGILRNFKKVFHLALPDNYVENTMQNSHLDPVRVKSGYHVGILVSHCYYNIWCFLCLVNSSDHLKTHL